MTRKLHVNAAGTKDPFKTGDDYIFAKGDFHKARAYYDSAYTLHDVTKDRFGVAEVELGRGIVYTKEGNYDDALIKIENSLAVAKELNARVLEIKCFNQLSTLWEMKGDFKKSLDYFKEYQTT